MKKASLVIQDIQNNVYNDMLWNCGYNWNVNAIYHYKLYGI